MTFDVVNELLRKRGIIGAEDVAQFLNPDYLRDTHDPFLLNDIRKATTRIFDAMDAGERIAIYSDFDCDGIPGAVVAHDFFAKIGYANVEYYIPHRDREGYGFHTSAIDELKERGVTLIITIDVGTVAFEGIAHAQGRGIDVIVTDHHEVREGMMPYALVNPKLSGYPFPNLCGAAVMWKLVSALVKEGKERARAEFLSIPEGWEKWLLDVVAIATIADLVPLVGENRALAHFGMTVLRKSRRPGIRALCASARIRQAEIDETDIGFTFAPRINAASRMDKPELAFRLLSTSDPAEAEGLAAQLESLNRKRRGVVASMVKEAKARMHARYSESDRVVVLGDVEWKPSLCGLAANSIMEGRGGGAVVVWGRDAVGRLKGSARSDGSISVVELFTRATHSLIEFGGHHASGGFSISHDAVHTLPETLAEAAEGLLMSQSASEKTDVEADLDLRLREIAPFFGDVVQLAPFGVGNPKPVVRIRAARITFARQFGKEMNHVEVQVICEESGARARAFQFFKSPMDFTFPPSVGSRVDVLATLERDSFRGPGRLALRIVDILEARN